MNNYKEVKKEDLIKERFTVADNKRNMQIYGYMKQFISLVAGLKTPYDMEKDMDHATINQAAKCFLDIVIKTAKTIKGDIELMDNLSEMEKNELQGKTKK